MKRYHDTNNDPLPIHSSQHDIERANINRLTSEFLLRGGEIVQIGHCMSDKTANFIINPERTPVYAHLFTQPEAIATRERFETVSKQCDDEHSHTERHATLIMIDAALGNSPKWIAQKHHMTEKYVRQVARDFNITFHTHR